MASVPKRGSPSLDGRAGVWGRDRVRVKARRSTDGRG